MAGDDVIWGAAVPALPVSDLERAIGFYESRLGMTALHREPRIAILGRDRVEIHLWLAGDERWRGRADNPVQSGAESFIAGTASCRVLVHAIDAFHASVDPAIIHPNGPLADKDYGMREFAVLDPDGNLVTFFAPLPSGE
ncbi:bleomycin resistance protein [Cucumibacter marinus]|uniref:bleomycin resistance protein n=1 Tax=Cucumibacter marinus TaxID=1121252 RepID=UPI000405EB73|nr:VOC family protein [Cucumibacter marinus]